MLAGAARCGRSRPSYRAPHHPACIARSIGVVCAPSPIPADAAHVFDDPSSPHRDAFPGGAAPAQRGIPRAVVPRRQGEGRHPTRLICAAEIGHPVSEARRTPSDSCRGRFVLAVRKGRIPHCAMRLPQSRRGGAPPRIGAWRRRRYETSMRTVSSGAGSHARPVRTALPRRMPEAVPAMFRHDVGSVGERRAHTPQVAGSTPARRRLDSSVEQSIGLINRVSRVRLPLQATPGRKSLTRKHPARCSAGARPRPCATGQRSGVATGPSPSKRAGGFPPHRPQCIAIDVDGPRLRAGSAPVPWRQRQGCFHFSFADPRWVRQQAVHANRSGARDLDHPERIASPVPTRRRTHVLDQEGRDR